MPFNDADLQRELGIAKPEGSGKKLVELLQAPSLNIRGIRSGNVGELATNIVPDKAEASLEARLVKGEDPHKKFEQIANFIRQQGFFVVDHEPAIEERRAHPRVVKLLDQGGYRASRTPMDLPVSKALVRVMQEAKNNRTVVAPMMFCLCGMVTLMPRSPNSGMVSTNSLRFSTRNGRNMASRFAAT